MRKRVNKSKPATADLGPLPWLFAFANLGLDRKQPRGPHDDGLTLALTSYAASQLYDKLPHEQAKPTGDAPTPPTSHLHAVEKPGA